MVHAVHSISAADLLTTGNAKLQSRGAHTAHPANDRASTHVRHPALISPFGCSFVEPAKPPQAATHELACTSYGLMYDMKFPNYPVGFAGEPDVRPGILE